MIFLTRPIEKENKDKGNDNEDIIGGNGGDW